jgi:hypothetical protein
MRADHMQFLKGWPFCVHSHRKEMICDGRTCTFDIVKVFLDFSIFKITHEDFWNFLLTNYPSACIIEVMPKNLPRFWKIPLRPTVLVILFTWTERNLPLIKDMKSVDFSHSFVLKSVKLSRIFVLKNVDISNIYGII